jgi:hypothetical protein
MTREPWKKRAVLLLGGVTILVLCALVMTATAWRYTTLGHVVRFLAGESGAEQTANDLADELQGRIGATKLQQWAVGVLARYQGRTLRLAGRASYWSEGSVKLAPAEVPTYLTHTWPETPEVSVRLSPAGQPECVVVGWYLYGIFVGPPSYRATENPWYLRQVQPGVYVYHGYK